jgi:hypothetical protein
MHGQPAEAPVCDTVLRSLALKKIIEGWRFRLRIRGKNNGGEREAMDESKLDSALALLAARSHSPDWSPDFYPGVWQRIGKMQERRDRRGRSLLGLGVAVVALGAGLGTSGIPLYAQAETRVMVETSPLAPSALLHISQ